MLLCDLGRELCSDLPQKAQGGRADIGRRVLPLRCFEYLVLETILDRTEGTFIILLILSMSSVGVLLWIAIDRSLLFPKIDKNFLPRLKKRGEKPRPPPLFSGGGRFLFERFYNSV